MFNDDRVSYTDDDGNVSYVEYYQESADGRHVIATGWARQRDDMVFIAIEEEGEIVQFTEMPIGAVERIISMWTMMFDEVE